jgi:membrane associated rhomboid family serine protease
VIVGYIIINWNGFDLIGGQLKCQIFFTAILIIIFIIIFSVASSLTVDYYGHLGGFMFGLWLSSVHETIIDTKR